MKEVNYFGNLINERQTPYKIREFEARAIAQKKFRDKGLQLYIIDNNYAVARVKNGKITRYTILGDIDNYKELYTNSRDNEAVCRQALYHGACLLTRRAGKTIGLGYDL